ncbi:MAG: HEAT repeat domain-containing protein [Cyanophyceae cyanobacterium]
MSHNLPFLACFAVSLSSCLFLLMASPSFSPRSSLLAQTTDATDASSTYDHLMQAGYEATEQRDYQTALQYFQQALAERPNDFYAQQAINNVESYLERSRLAEAETETANPWNLIFLALVVGGGFSILLVWLLRRTPPEPFLEEEIEPLTIADQEPEPSVPPSVSTSEPELPQSIPISTSSSFALPAPQPDSAPSIPTSPYQAETDLVNELIQELEQADSKKRRRAIWELTQRGDSRAVEPLVKRLIHSDSQERSLILEALTRISARTLQPMNQAVTVSLEDESPQVRQNAIRELTQVYELMSQVNHLLSLTLNDPDAEVQSTAHWALNQMQLSHLLNADIG